MNKDFHYYATYVAAMTAGFRYQDAQKIAYAAQYVDDSSISMINTAYLPGLSPVPTAQQLSELIYDDIWWSETKLINAARVWVPFHMLPGNYGANSDIQVYNGTRSSSDSTGTYKWYFDDESNEEFKLLCQKDSLLVSEMINDTINHTGEDYILHLIGLRMHVMADTWAHCNFAGIPAWFINETEKEVTNMDTGDLIKIDERSPDALAFNSYSYLGHGRMGHLPDYPYLHYSYHSQWKGQKVPIIKNNSTLFLDAFRQMVTAMRRIINHTRFDPKIFDPIDDNTLNVVLEILQKKNNDQCNDWKKNISRIIVKGEPLRVPEDYNIDAWLTAAQKASDKKKTDYYFFNISAILHLSLVENSLKANGIFIGETPQSNILHGTLRTEVGYVQQRKNPAPILGEDAILLQVVKANNQILKNGDVVKIKTSEYIKDGKNYLGAWPQGVYYYFKDENISKQKWKIIKRFGSQGDNILPTDTVFLQNIHYDNVPFLNYYKGLFNENYLTTTDLSKDWVLDYFNSGYKISTFANHGMALKIDGTIAVWGENDSHQCDIPTGLSNIISIDAGHRHCLALRIDGTVTAWGNNKFNQSTVPTDLNNVIAVAAGGAHSLALRNDGIVVAWGDNRFNQKTVPSTLNNVTDIAAGTLHSLALRNDGTVVAWGQNEFHKTDVPYGLTNVKAIAAGNEYSLALRSDGIVVSWGTRGVSGTPCFEVPKGLNNVIAIAAGTDHCLALKNDGTIVGWGDNANQQLDIPKGLNNVIAIAAGAAHSLALKNDGTIESWGDNSHHQRDIPHGLNLIKRAK